MVTPPAPDDDRPDAPGPRPADPVADAGGPTGDERTFGIGLIPAPGDPAAAGNTAGGQAGDAGHAGDAVTAPRDRLVREPRAVVEVDVLAVGRGAVPALVVAAGAALVARVLDAVADDGSPLAFPLLLVALAGLIGGGWEAARSCARLPLTHAALAALVAIGVLLTANIGWRLLDGQDVRWGYVGTWALLAVACGVVGGLLALRAPRRRADSVP
jgi:hypothetical protein